MTGSMPGKLLAVLATLAALSACNLERVPAAPLSPASSAAAPSVEDGIPISATPIHILIPPGLATGATADSIDLVTDQTGAPWDVAPAHMRITLQGYPVEITSHVPEIFVYPAQEYASLNPTAAESLRRLEAVLSNPAASYENNALPHVPFYNAGQVFAAQQKVLHFSGGAGVRFATQYAQAVSPINNGGLFYQFQGLTGDGKYYVIAVLPLNLPFLAADNNPESAVSSAGIPFPPPSASGASYEDYFRELGGKIDAAPASQFSPVLGALDALMQSVTFDQ